MKRWIHKVLFCPLVIVLVITVGCNKDDEITPEEDQQIITTVRLVMTQVGTLDEVVLTYRDPDGNGGNDPVIEGGNLSAQTVYFAMIEEIHNETESPVEDVKALIENDNESFQIFFQSNQIDASLQYADRDDSGLPLGLFTAITTGNASSGFLIVSIVESPNKTAAGVADGLIGNAGGRTLLQMNFPITID